MDHLRFCGADWDSFLEWDCIVYFVLEDDRGLDVSGWRSEHLNKCVDLEIGCLLFDHGDESCIKGEIYAMFLFDTS